MPEEDEAAADEGRTEDRELACSWYVADAQVGRELVVTRKIGDRAENHSGDEHAADGEAVEAVSEVHRVRATDANEYEERASDTETGEERPAERLSRPQRAVEYRHPDLAEAVSVGRIEQDDAQSDERDEPLPRQLHTSGNTVGASVTDF